MIELILILITICYINSSKNKEKLHFKPYSLEGVKN
jgi:hypothetical protein